MHLLLPKSAEIEFLMIRKGLDRDQLAKQLKLSRRYVDGLLCGEKTFKRRREQLELILGQPIWSTADQFARLKKVSSVIPWAIPMDKQDLLKICRDQKIIHPNLRNQSREKLLEFICESQPKPTAHV